MNATVTQWRTEVSLSLRQGEQMLVSLGIPVLILVFFSLVDVLPVRPADSASAHAVDALFPSVLALAIMATAMVSLGIGTGFERHHRVLKRLGATPLGRPRLIAAKTATVLSIELVQLVVLVPVAGALGWRPGGQVVLVLAAYVVGTAAFAGIGLLLAGTLDGVLNLAVNNAVFVLLLLFGGIIIPADRLPGPLASIAHVLPSSALAEVLRGAMVPGAPAAGTAWLILAVWAVAAPVLAARLFRWE
jgi:ABC-2 type transport system permease protein